MQTLAEKSRLSIDAALLLIVGRENPPAGLYLGTFRGSSLEDWCCGSTITSRRGNRGAESPWNSPGTRC